MPLSAVTVRGRDILRDGRKVGRIIGGRSSSSKRGASGGYGYVGSDGAVLVPWGTFPYFDDVKRDAVFFFGPHGGGKNLGAAMPPGFRFFTADDVFAPQPAAAPRTAAHRFEYSQRGYTFDAHGRTWQVIHDFLPPGQRTITGSPRLMVMNAQGRREEEPLLYAALEGDTLVVSKLNARGTELRPVGRPLWREKLA